MIMFNALFQKLYGKLPSELFCSANKQTFKLKAAFRSREKWDLD